MHIPWLCISAPVRISVHGFKTSVEEDVFLLHGILRLRARREVLVKTASLRVFPQAPPRKRQKLSVKALASRVVMLDRTLPAGEYLEMPIALSLPVKPVYTVHDLSLSIEIATHPDRPRSEWRANLYSLQVR